MTNSLYLAKYLQSDWLKHRIVFYILIRNTPTSKRRIQWEDQTI